MSAESVKATGMTGDATGQGGADPKRWIVLLVLSLAQLMDILDGTIVNIALPTAQRDLGFGLDDRQWIVTGYALAYGSLLLFGGRLSDRFGRRRLFLVGLIGFALSSAAGGAASSFGMLLGARIAQGAFAAALAPAALSLVSVTFAHDAKERGKAFGVFGAVSGMGGAIGLVLGGVLTDSLSWRWCLYVNVFIAAIALTGALIFIHDDGRQDSERSLDLPGAAMITAGLFGIVFGLSNSAVHGWGNVGTWAPVVIGALLIVGFIIREKRVERPLLPLSVVLDRNRGASYLAIGVAGIGSFAVFLYLTYYLQQTLRFSALQAGLAFLPFAAALIIGAGLAGSLLPRIGPRPLIPIGALFCAGSLALLTRIGRDSHYLTGVLPSVLLFGLGVGLTIGSAQNIATTGVRPEDSGVASAMVNTMQQVGGSLGLALFTSVSATAINRYITTHTSGSNTQLQTDAALSSYHTVFWVAAAIFIAGAAVTAALFQPGSAQPAEQAQTTHR